MRNAEEIMDFATEIPPRISVDRQSSRLDSRRCTLELSNVELVLNGGIGSDPLGSDEDGTQEEEEETDQVLMQDVGVETRKYSPLFPRWIPNWALGIHLAVLGLAGASRMGLTSGLYLLLFSTLCAGVSLQRSALRAHTIAFSVLLSFASFMVQLVSNFVQDNRPEWRALGLLERLNWEQLQCCLLSDIAVFAGGVVFLGWSRHQEATKAAKPNGVSEEEEVSGTPESRSQRAIRCRWVLLQLEVASYTSLLVAGTIQPAALPSTYIVLLVVLINMRLQGTLRTSKSAVLSMQGFTAAQLIITYAVQFDDVSTGNVRTALSALVAMDANTPSADPGCCVQGLEFWVFCVAQMCFLMSTSWHLWITEHEMKEFDGHHMNRRFDLTESKLFAFMIQWLTRYRNVAVSLIALVWALTYPGLLTVPMLVVGMLSITVRTKSHSPQAQPNEIEANQCWERQVQEQQQHISFSGIHSVFIPYCILLVVAEYVWYIPGGEWGTLKDWRRFGIHLPVDPVSALAPKVIVLLLLFWLLHPTWFYNYAHQAMSRKQSCIKQTPKNLLLHFLSYVSKAAAAETDGEEVTDRPKSISELIWIARVRFADLVVRIRTRVLIASSRFSTFWLNIYMAILWVAVVGLVIKETLSVPSCMNGIYLIFVINATFRMTDMVQTRWCLAFLQYLFVSIMLRYVWIFVKADFDLNEDLVELIGFQKETGEDVLWQPLWSSDFLMHVLLFGIVCLQVRTLDARHHAATVYEHTWGTSKLSWVSYLCASFSLDFMWGLAHIAKLCLGVMRPVQGYAALPGFGDLVAVVSIVLIVALQYPNKFNIYRKQVLRQRVLLVVLLHVWVQYIYLMGVYLCQIGNAYQRVREVWHDTLNMDRVLTLEDIGLYETRDTVELFWSIIYRLVVLTVSIIHYNVLHWSWRRVEWAAKTLQAIFRKRKTRQTGSIHARQLMLTLPQQSPLQLRSSKVRGEASNMCQSRQSQPVRSHPMKQAYSSFLYAWNLASSFLTAILGSRYVLLMFVALRVCARVNFAGFVLVCTISICMTRHAFWRDNGRETGNSWEDAKTKSVVHSPLLVRGLWATTLLFATASVGLLYMFQFSEFKPGGIFAFGETSRLDISWVGLYQLDDPRIAERYSVHRMCCEHGYNLEDPTPGAAHVCQSDSDPADSMDSHLCPASYSGLWWLLKWDYLIFVMCCIQRINALRSGVRIQRDRENYRVSRNTFSEAFAGSEDGNGSSSHRSRPYLEGSSSPSLRQVIASRSAVPSPKDSAFHTADVEQTEISSTPPGREQSHMRNQRINTAANFGDGTVVTAPNSEGSSAKRRRFEHVQTSQDFRSPLAAEQDGKPINNPMISRKASVTSQDCSQASSWFGMKAVLGEYFRIIRNMCISLAYMRPVWKSEYWRSKHTALVSYHMTILSLLLAAFVRTNLSSLLYITLLGFLVPRNSARSRKALVMSHWWLPSSVAVLFTLQYALAMGAPPSFYIDQTISWLSPPLEEDADTGQQMCRRCTRRRFWMSFLDCRESDLEHSALEPCARIANTGFHLLFDFTALFFIMHFVRETQKLKHRFEHMDSENDDRPVSPTPTPATGLDEVSTQSSRVGDADSPPTDVWWETFNLNLMKGWIYFTMTMLLVVPLAARDSSIISTGYFLIFIFYWYNFERLTANHRIFQTLCETSSDQRDHVRAWWNPKLLTVLTYYNYGVLALKLFFCVPEVLPMYLNLRSARRDDTCHRGTEGCELINEVLGIRKLGDSCDGISCTQIFSFTNGGPLGSIILFTIIYIQRQIFHNLSYVYWVSATFSKQGRRNRARAAGARHAAHIMQLKQENELYITQQLKQKKLVIHNLSELEARVRRWEAVLFGSGQDIAPPRAPTRPACVAKSPTSVLVSWARDHHDNGLPVKLYIISRQKKSHEQFTFLGDFSDPVYASAKKMRMLVKDLLPGTTYQFHIAAANLEGVGAPSEPSAPVTTPMTKPKCRSTITKKEDSRQRLLEIAFTPLRGAHRRVTSKDRFPEIVPEISGESAARTALGHVQSSSSIGSSKSQFRATSVDPSTSQHGGQTSRSPALEFTGISATGSEPELAASSNQRGGTARSMEEVMPAAARSSMDLSMENVQGKSAEVKTTSEAKPTGSGEEEDNTNQEGELPAGRLSGLRTELGKACGYLEKEISSGLLRHVSPALFPDRIKQAQQLGLVHLLVMVLRSNTELLCWLTFLVNVMVHANLLSLVYPVTMFLVALLSSPTCDYKVWVCYTAYTMIVMLAKLVFELPLFCMLPEASDNANTIALAREDESYWWPSLQPYCPNEIPYDHAMDSGRSKGAAVFLLLKKPPGDTLLHWMWVDVVTLAVLLFHNYHLTMLGCWRGEAYTEVQPHCGPEMVTRYGTSFLGSVLNEAEKTVRCFFANVLASDEVRIDVGTEKEAARTHDDPEEVALEVHMPDTRQGPDFLGVSMVGKPGIDLYVPTFVTQLLIDLFALIYLHRISGSMSSVAEGLKSNQFPASTIVIFLFGISIMILERIIYLKEWVRVKLILHYLTVLMGHYFVFLVSPLYTDFSDDTFQKNPHLQVFYVLLVVYFTLSAMQLHYGFKQGSQFGIAVMAIGKGPVSRFFFNIYMLFPFLFEIRTILDWVSAHTSLDMFMWFTVEWTYVSIFRNQMVMAVRKEKAIVYSGNAPTFLMDKIIFGVIIFAAIMLILVLPVVMFSSLNPSLNRNPVMEVQMELSVQAEYGQYSLWTQTHSSIKEMSSRDYALLKNDVGIFLDVTNTRQCAVFDRFASNNFLMSSGAIDRLEDSLCYGGVCNAGAQGANITSNDSYYDNVKLAMSVTMFRRGPPGSEVVVDKWEQPLDVVQRAQLARIIRGDNSTTLTVPRMYPRAVRLPASDSTMLVDTQREKWLGLVLQAQRSSLISRYYVEVRNQQGGLPGETSNGLANPLASSALGDVSQFCGESHRVERGPVLSLLNDHYVEGLVETLGLASYRIIGVYALVLFTVKSIVRRVLMKTWTDILMREMEDSSDLMHLCYGIRQLHSLKYHGRLKDEVKLYGILIQILQNPEFLVKVTRHNTPTELLLQMEKEDDNDVEEHASGTNNEEAAARVSAHQSSDAAQDA